MFKRFFTKRLREQSTWRGLLGFLTLFGIALSPEQVETIAGAGVALYLAVETFLPDRAPGDSVDDGLRGDNPGRAVQDPTENRTVRRYGGKSVDDEEYPGGFG